MLLAVTAPADNERGPRYMEKALAAVHQATRLKPGTISLLIAAHDARVGIALRCDNGTESVVAGG
jgi:hypothetical protein